MKLNSDALRVTKEKVDWLCTVSLTGISPGWKDPVVVVSGTWKVPT